MADLVINIPSHGYSDGDTVYVSWLDGIYYIATSNINLFRLATESGGTDYVEYTGDYDGYVIEVDATSGVKIVSGLEHLEGQTVCLSSNGSEIGRYTVTSGSITSPVFVFSYSVGLPYAFKAKTMRLEVPQSNTIQSRIKRINEATVRYIRSKGGSVGQIDQNTELLNDLGCTFSTSSQDATSLISGGYDENGIIVISNDCPYPMTVLATIISFTVDENR